MMKTNSSSMRCGLRFVAPLLLFPALALSGCSLSSNRAQELVESRLRQQEDTIRTLENQLQQSQQSIAALQQEADSLRLASQQGIQQTLPEQGEPSFRVQKIEISSLMSGGIDRDQSPGDDQFTVLLSPLDGSGKALRVAGELEIEVFDFTRPTDGQRIGHWSLNRATTSELWHQGIVGTGYQFTSTWQQLPQSTEVYVHARLTTVDGRQFDSTSKLRVTPPAATEAMTFELPKSGERVVASKSRAVGWTKSAQPTMTDETDEEAPAFLPEP